MIALIIKYLLPIKLVAAAIAVAVAYWFVWDTGRGFERALWESASAEEVSRQRDISEDAQRASEVAAGRLLKSEATRRSLVRRLRNEATLDPDADAMCINPAGSLRLNAIGGNADPD